MFAQFHDTPRPSAIRATVKCWHTIPASAQRSSPRELLASNDPLYGIRMTLRCGEDKLTDRQRARLARAITADEAHVEVYVAWQCAQQLRAA